MNINYIDSLNLLLLILIIAWSLAWKGMGLWASARKGQKVWFIAILIVNSMGILEIIYFISEKIKAKRKSKSSK